jgi:hypothetical protein
VLVLLVFIGALFFRLVEGQTFLHALSYAVGTVAMYSPGWGPQTVGAILFNLIYLFLGVGHHREGLCSTAKSL